MLLQVNGTKKPVLGFIVQSQQGIWNPSHTWFKKFQIGSGKDDQCIVWRSCWQCQHFPTCMPGYIPLQTNAQTPPITHTVKSWSHEPGFKKCIKVVIWDKINCQISLVIHILTLISYKDVYHNFEFIFPSYHDFIYHP